MKNIEKLTELLSFWFIYLNNINVLSYINLVVNIVESETFKI